MKLSNAYPRTPDAFHKMIDETLARLPKDDAQPLPRAHRVPRARALLVAALIALMCGGAALAAAQLGLLDMVFGDRRPSKAAEQTLALLDESDASEGYSLAACQYLIDGDKVHINYALSADVPDGALALVRVSADADGYISGGVQGADVLRALGEGFEQNQQLYDVLIYDELPDRPFEVTVDAWLLRPGLPVKAYAPTEAELLGIDSGAPPAQDDIILANECSGLVFLGQRNDFAAASDYGASASDPESVVKLLGELGIAGSPVRLSVTFTVDPDNSAGALRRLEKPIEFEFDEYSLTVRRADFNSASALILFEVHPLREIAEMDMYNDDPLYRHYEARMPDGTPIDAVNGGGFSTVRDAQGVYLDYELRLSGVNQLPDAITLTPYRTSSDGTMIYAEDETVMIPLTSGKTEPTD